VLDDGTESNAWISVTPLVHDIAISLDGIASARARLHHVGFAVDNREDVLRAADICVDHEVFIESGPSKHKISQQFFLYVYEPGGNRIEIVAGGYLIFAPDWEPITWTRAERSNGQAWGLRLPRSFHTHRHARDRGSGGAARHPRVRPRGRAPLRSGSRSARTGGHRLGGPRQRR
jgi:catechol 2,3-dioxygenase